MVARLKIIKCRLLFLPLAIISASAFASTSSSISQQQEQMTTAMQSVATQAQQLQQQMQTLQKQMAQLQQEQAALDKQAKQVKAAQTQLAAAKQTTVAPVPAPTATATAPTPNLVGQEVPVNPAHPNPNANPYGTLTAGKTPYGGTTLANIGGFAVITSPYLHPESAYSGGDLIVNYSSINKDASLLQQRQEFQQAMSAKGFGMPKSGSLVELSGEIEGDASYTRNFDGSHNSDLYIGDAELDVQALMNRWITGLLTFNYNTDANSVGSRLVGNINMVNAFMVFGNLNITPWRVTMGQLYVPFGQFNSFLITNPVNKTLFRTLAQPIIIGYGVPGTDGFSGSSYTFKGLTHNYGAADLPNPYINQFGADANYQFNMGPVQTTLGASFIRNVADALGFQANGEGPPQGAYDGPFDGFDEATQTEKLAKVVPGMDFRAQLAIANWLLIGEYTAATTNFAYQDLNFDGAGAQPQDVHVEGVYLFSMFDKPTNIALGVDRSWQALALNVPAVQIALAFNYSPWRNTIASLEYRHDINYSSNDTAGGNVGEVPVVVTGPAGPNSDAVTLQFQAFF